MFFFLIISEVKGAKYTEGIYLLYPEPGESPSSSLSPSSPSSHLPPHPNATRSASSPPTSVTLQEVPHHYDIIFIHGVNGHPFYTWTAGEDNESPVGVTAVDPHPTASVTAAAKNNLRSHLTVPAATTTAKVLL